MAARCLTYGHVEVNALVPVLNFAESTADNAPVNLVALGCYLCETSITLYGTTLASRSENTPP